MPFYTDLHIHSKYSRATSKNGNLDELAIWARKKGLNLIATGDFTHPAWFEEIKEKLVPLGDGTFKLKDGASDVKFLLNVEISTIYKKGDKTRKVHHVVFMPNLEAAEKFRNRLSAIGNINSDGRPILGLDSRNLLEIVLESSDDAFLIPAHIWTPWFSALGSKSGFNSIEECYDDLSPYIFAVETGLSSDPEMNWHVSSLDKYRLVSNSDAHSPANLAREATVFERELDYSGIMNALKNGDGYLGTIEFFPEEGKYHEDGHRKCNVCLTPEETAKVGGICPVCGKPLTIGVLNRVNELSDRKGSVVPPPKAGKVFSLVPLPEILSEIMQVGSSSKSVVAAYEDLIKKLGSELDILQTIPIEDISKAYSSLLGEGISRLRQGKVIRQAGFDGEYGIIRLFDDSELEKSKLGSLLFDIKTPEKKQKLKTHVEEFDLKNILDNVSKQNNEKQKPFELDEYQLNAVNSSSHQLLIVAGPGSGKTTVLTKRIANMISKNIVSAENCLAITFTRRAADEMRSRLKYNINIHTFHSLCFSILKENYEAAGLKPDFQVSADSKILKKIDDTDEKDNEDLKDGKLNNDDLLSFDDLIILAVKLLKENENIANFYREKFKYVSVDEYQDIDENQYELIRLLVPSNGSICVIGDPNQAIYGFRGGDSKFFKNFANDYPEAKTISLKNNYRSIDTIVNASNQMINSYNIISAFDRPHEKITIHAAPTEKAEAEFIVKTIEGLIGGHNFFSIDTDRAFNGENNFSFSDFAILYRSSSQLKPIVEALKRSGMPFVNLSNGLLCDNKDVKKFLRKLNKTKSIVEQIENKFQGEEYIKQYLISLAQKYTTKDDFINQLSLLNESDILDKNADRISLMTLHASKGLEFKCVFIAGLEDGLLPFYRAEDIEEEKRLFYVGMTRAEQLLYLTRAVKRKQQGVYKTLPISPFLKKIEEDLINLSRFDKKFSKKEEDKQMSFDF